MGIIAWLIVGVIAGWLAGVVVKGGGFGIAIDMIIGVVGAFIGGWLAGKFGIHISSGWIDSVITATGGAIILLFILRLIKQT
ncbi:GlsB/YeaQ/YmgE family stress response membrane protein [Glaciimonas soli]|uniref:GlsB/YeaQ/YmgE family stress response membrane protein n=1 Tax=Glaciimonas soli TaxID=2590999 RepID=A0A843YYS1_9BURK|nr:GlsB/YeaQ/YmgE family stress response membrane protein [Glaciimonas soli]MQR02342.1 GlsB/YeaQ/YmgE family stress response membrane protein [Glaciimonas soli]